MGHLCQFCERSFSRRYNRDRHEKHGCHKRLEEGIIESYPTSFGQGKPKDMHEDTRSQDEYDDDVYHDVDKDETEVEEEDFSDKDNQSMTSVVNDETEAEEEDFSDEDDKSTTSTVEDNNTDPDTVNNLNTAWEEQVKQYTMQGLLKNDAEHRASSLLLPAYRKRLRVLYLDYLKWHQGLKTYSVHKQVMKTLHRFMDDEEMDYAEAAEAAINKRKYLLNRLIKYEDVSEETSNDNENEELSHTTARKRKCKL